MSFGAGHLTGVGTQQGEGRGGGLEAARAVRFLVGGKEVLDAGGGGKNDNARKKTLAGNAVSEGETGKPEGVQDS